MRRSIRLALLLTLLIPGLALAQAPGPRDIDEEIQEARKLREKYEAGETEQDRRWVEAVNARLELLGELSRTRVAVAALPSAEESEARKKEVEAEIARLKSRKDPTSVRMEEASELPGFQARRDEAEKERKAARKEYEDLQTLMSDNGKERQGRAARASQAKRERDALTGEDEYTKYRLVTAGLEAEVLEARDEYLKQALTLQKPQLELLERRRALADARLEREQKILDLAEERAAELRNLEALKDKDREKYLRRKADEARKRGEHVTALVHDLNADAAQARSRTKAIQNGKGILRTSIDDLKLQAGRLRTKKAHLDRRIEFGDAEVAKFLRDGKRQALQDIQDLQENARPEIDAGAAATQSELIKVLDTIYELKLPLKENQEFLDVRALVDKESWPEAESKVQGAIEGEDGLLMVLRAKRLALEETQTLQGELAATLSETLHELKLFLEFVRAHMLFSQSDEPISTETLRAAIAEVPKIIDTYRDPGLRQETSDYVRRVTRAGFLLILGLMITSIVVVLPTLIRKRAGISADPAARSEAPEFMGHGVATIRFLAAALPPAGFFLAYGLLSDLELPSPLDEVLPLGFLLFGVLLSIGRMTRWFLHPAGVGIHIMGIAPENARGIRRTIYLATVTALFLAVPAKLIVATDSKLTHLPRLLDLAWLIILAGCLFVLTRRRGPVLRQITGPGQIMDRLWIFVGPLVALILLAMVLLELAGYQVASETIAKGILRSFIVMIAAVLLYSFLVKLVGKLAKRVRSRLVSDVGYAAARESSEEVSDQLTRLAAILIVGSVILLLLGSWDEIIVLFDLLEEVQLLTLGPDRFLTLLSVLRAVLSVAAGHFIVANLSAVYEFVVFPLLGSTKRGGQFVLLALSRYAILLVAYSVALVFLGIQFSSITWLLTAASVGIGFGLQEIIANFISGLIILLERPFQVGDIITVENTEGVVDSISIRSTIVTNWDRKNVIVPNKDFITKTLTNWTRNDQVTRRKLEIRVAFGSDLEKVNRVISETLNAHPNVLTDPPPRIWMSSYEASGFGILVYFFCHVDNGLTTRAELYGQVFTNLAGEGIEVPVQKHQVSVIHEPPAADGPGEAE